MKTTIMNYQDSIIKAYQEHPKAGPKAETAEFRELSEKFHEVCRQIFYAARVRGHLNGGISGPLDQSE